MDVARRSTKYISEQYQKFTSFCAQPRNLILFTTHVSVVFYALSFWIQLGTLPFITNKLDVDPVTFGNLQTTFGVAQLIGGPLFGRFGDLYGSRTALTLSFVSAFLSYSLLGLANTIFILFMSRLSSVFMHAMQGAQMIITDLSLPEQRAESLGKLSVSYGIGMVLGPIIGGLCTKYANEQFSAFVAAGCCVFSLVVVNSFIPRRPKELISLEETKKKDEASDDVDEIEEDKTPPRLLDLQLFLTLVWRNPTARHLLFIKIVSGIPIGILQSMLSMILLNNFGASPEVNGYVLSYSGILSMLTQGFVVGKLAKLGLKDATLINISVLVLSLTFLSMFLFVSGVIGFAIVALPMIVSGNVFSALVQGNLTKSVSPENTGSILGFSMATHSLIRSISPIIGGYMLQVHGFGAFGWLGAMCNGMLYIYLTLIMKVNSD